MGSQRRQLEKNPGFFVDLWAFMARNRKWWLLPVIVVFLGLGGLIALGGTSLAPFIYSLF